MFANGFDLFHIRIYKWMLQGYHVSVIKDQVWFKNQLNIFCMYVYSVCPFQIILCIVLLWITLLLSQAQGENAP